ncbi:MAG TPA: redoxin domain-containing protein [Aequorivita sp.]|nr:redoxin domain-containing protein [Aequorivita sp.]
MGRKLLYLIILISLSAQSQVEPRILLSEAIAKNIKTYVQKSQKAYALHDFDQAEFLFDSLINHVVNGSYMDNFQIRKRRGKKIELNKFKKPIFLMTYASWCAPGIGEIPALNKIAEKHYKDIDFVILFWDSKENVQKSSRNYSRRINVVYVDEKENTHNHIVQTLKHSLGFPTSFFMDKNKKILDVRRGELHPYNEKYEVSFELNYTSFLNGISLLKTLDDNPKDNLVLTPNP